MQTNYNQKMIFWSVVRKIYNDIRIYLTINLQNEPKFQIGSSYQTNADIAHHFRLNLNKLN